MISSSRSYMDMDEDCYFRARGGGGQCWWALFKTPFTSSKSNSFRFAYQGRCITDRWSQRMVLVGIDNEQVRRHTSPKAGINTILESTTPRVPWA